MATQQLKKNLSGVNEWIKLARKRVKVPRNWIEAKYRKEADSLYIQILESPAAYSDDDLSKSVVYDYDENNRLVGIEVLNLRGVFV
jgi:uncharacterized protein YuzE